MTRTSTCGALLAALILGGAVGSGPLVAQDLADYDYENLSFRGIGLEWGYMVPTRVESTQSMGIRVDLGYLGPGLRIVPGVSYWSSPLEKSERSAPRSSHSREPYRSICQPMSWEAKRTFCPFLPMASES